MYNLYFENTPYRVIKENGVTKVLTIADAIRRGLVKIK